MGGGVIDMKYFKHLNDSVVLYYQPENTNIYIPEAVGNADYDKILEEVAAGTSTVVEVDDTPVVTYADARRAAYASIGDQLDMQYHDAVDNTTTWKDHVKSVKDANPKE